MQPFFAETASSSKNRDLCGSGYYDWVLAKIKEVDYMQGCSVSLALEACVDPDLQTMPCLQDPSQHVEQLLQRGSATPGQPHLFYQAPFCMKMLAPAIIRNSRIATYP